MFPGWDRLSQYIICSGGSCSWTSYGFLIQAGFVICPTLFLPLIQKLYAVTSWIKERHDNGANHIALNTFSSPSGLRKDLPENLKLWFPLSTEPLPTHRILWFSTDSTEILSAAEEIVVKTSSTTGRFQISIDLRGSQSVPVAFIRKLASISLLYISELVRYSYMYGFTELEKNAQVLEKVRFFLVFFRQSSAYMPVAGRLCPSLAGR
jgi:hypothetical protein